MKITFIKRVGNNVFLEKMTYYLHNEMIFVRLEIGEIPALQIQI